MSQKLKRLFALLLIVFIPFALMLWYRIHETGDFASRELIMYPLLFGGGLITLLLIIKRYFLKESFKDFNTGKGSTGTDILWGLGLTAVYFILFFIERAILMDVLQFNSNTELLGLMLDMRESPVLMILWFGPVLWIGIALYEELIRIFMLTTLWKFSTSSIWSVGAILLTSILTGLSHWNQGSYGIVTIALKSIVMCFFFLRYKRLLPLVISHALYDGIQVGILLMTYQ